MHHECSQCWCWLRKDLEFVVGVQQARQVGFRSCCAPAHPTPVTIASMLEIDTWARHRAPAFPSLEHLAYNLASFNILKMLVSQHSTHQRFHAPYLSRSLVRPI